RAARAGAPVAHALKLRVAAASETSFATWIEVIDRPAPDGCLIRIPPPRHGPGETPAGGDVTEGGDGRSSPARLSCVNESACKDARPLTALRSSSLARPSGQSGRGRTRLDVGAPGFEPGASRSRTLRCSSSNAGNGRFGS